MKKVFFLTLVLIGKALHGQESKPDLYQQVENKLTHCFRNYYSIDSNFSKVACRQSAVFIKFKVNASGKLDSLDFTKGTPDPIQIALRKALLTVKGPWVLRSDEVQKLKITTFVLPFLFVMRDGCLDTNRSFEIGNPKKRKPQSAPVASSLSSFDQTRDAIVNILNFQSGYLDTWNCKILSPVQIGGTIY